jgi:hypothetical protein
LRPTRYRDSRLHAVVYFNAVINPFIADFDLNVLLLFKCPGGPGHQMLDVVDNLADVIGYTSGGIRRIGASLIGCDIKLGILPACLRSGRHAGGIPTDHQKALSGHIQPPFEFSDT